jgi:hypothetical protein
MGLCRQCLVFVTALLSAGVAMAHHSFAAIFDSDKPLTVTGTVTSVDWANPHVHFSIEVRGEDGAVAEWRFEGFPPNMLVRQGWRRSETLKLGDTVTVQGWQARAEPYLGSVRQIKLADGRELMAGPPASIGGR